MIKQRTYKYAIPRARGPQGRYLRQVVRNYRPATINIVENTAQAGTGQRNGVRAAGRMTRRKGSKRRKRGPRRFRRGT